MQTDPVTVQFETCKVKLIRKCPSLDHDEGFFVKITPIQSVEREYESIKNELKSEIGYTGVLEWDNREDSTVTFIPKP